MCSLVSFAVLGIHRGLPEELIRSHALDYRRTIAAFRDESVDIPALAGLPYLNSDLASIIGQP